MLLAQKSRDFTTEQMQNRHQWEVNDLKAAGLNPILSAGGTPSMGGSAQATMQDTGAAAMSAANSAKQLAMMDAQLKNVEADTRKKQAEADTTDNLGAVYAKDWQIKDQAVRKGKPRTDMSDLLGEVTETSKNLANSAKNIVNSKMNGYRLGPNKANPGMRLRVNR